MKSGNGPNPRLQDAANIVAVVGIMVLLWQLRQTQKIENVRLAVEATAPIQSKEFLDAYLRLTTAYEQDPQMLNTSSLDDDLMLVLNVYENIGVLYFNGLLQDNIVELRLYNGMQRIAPILEAKKWRGSSSSHFHSTLERMHKRMREHNP